MSLNLSVRIGSFSGSGFVVPDAFNTGSRIADEDLDVIDDDYVMSVNENLSGKKINGALYPNFGATVTDCVMTFLGVNMLPGGNWRLPVVSGFTAQYCNIGTSYSIGGQDITIDHCRYGNVIDTFLTMADRQNGSDYMICTDWTVTNNLFDRLINNPDTGGHFEAIHTFGLLNSLIENNYFDYGSTADDNTKVQITGVWSMGPGNGTGVDTGGNTWRSNYVHGGGVYQVYAGVQGDSFFDNQFFGYGAALQYQYPVGPPAGTCTITAQSGNTSDGSPFTFAQA